MTLEPDACSLARRKGWADLKIAQIFMCSGTHT
jgi:hypothetical protein